MELKDFIDNLLEIERAATVLSKEHLPIYIIDTKASVSHEFDGGIGVCENLHDIDGDLLDLEEGKEYIALYIG